MFSVEPEVPSSVAVSAINRRNVTVSWSVGDTHTVNATYLYYRVTRTDSWHSVSVTGTKHTVTSLTPGTSYQFYVKVTSYGKNLSSQYTTAMTGEVDAHFRPSLDDVIKQILM